MYLDHAAATPLDTRVLEAMQPYFSELFFNPSSPYDPAVQVRRDVEAARARIARVIGARSDEIIFTAGATESINIAFASILNSGGVGLVPSIEHHSVLEAAKRYNHAFIEPTQKGEITPEAVKKALTSETKLVSVALANNELGTIQPLVSIAAVIKDERERRQLSGNKTPLYLHTDASQAAGLLDIHLSRLGVDLLTLNAGKMYGPKQTGLLWAASNVSLAPFIAGGGQERGVRSGTEAVANIIGFATALELAEKSRNSEVKRLEKLRQELQDALNEAFDDVVIIRPKHQLANFVHAAWPRLDAERVIFRLEQKGVLVATGSACAANSGTRSHVLTAVGMTPELADGSLRLTLGKLNDEASTHEAARLIIEAVTAERERR